MVFSAVKNSGGAPMPERRLYSLPSALIPAAFSASFFLAPPVSHRARQRDRRGGGGQDHVLAGAEFNQRRIAFESGAQEALARQEEYRRLGRAGEMFPVGFAGQRGHVDTHLAQSTLDPTAWNRHEFE